MYQETVTKIIHPCEYNDTFDPTGEILKEQLKNVKQNFIKKEVEKVFAKLTDKQIKKLSKNISNLKLVKIEKLTLSVKDLHSKRYNYLLNNYTDNPKQDVYYKELIKNLQWHISRMNMAEIQLLCGIDCSEDKDINTKGKLLDYYLRLATSSWTFKYSEVKKCFISLYSICLYVYIQTLKEEINEIEHLKECINPILIELSLEINKFIK